MTGRELAWRVLAHELGASSEVEKGIGEKAPSYMISPLGARMNRVLVVGTVETPELTGPDLKTGVWRTRLTDPTGTVTVTASGFHPHAQEEVQRVRGATTAWIIGKPTLFRGSGGTPVASIRAESVRPVPESGFRALLADAARQTLDRLDLVLRLRASPALTDAELAQSGTSPAWVRGARASVARYPALDPGPYYKSLRAVLIALRGPQTADTPRVIPDSELDSRGAVVRVVHPRSSPAPPAAPAGIAALEGRLLEILDELAEGSPDGYADMDELAERAARHGLEEERMEELLNYLSEKGTIEEPLVGKFRRADGPPRE